jgi:hypothetical protein
MSLLKQARTVQVWKLRAELLWLDAQLAWVRVQLLVFS